MKDFRTYIKPIKTAFRISHSSNILLHGSCFAQEIGLKLSQHYFNTSHNPFGIVFNPLSIYSQFNRIISRVSYSVDELIYHNSLYHSMDHHGAYSGIDKNKVIDYINSNLEQSWLNLKKADYLILSFGSAYYYSLVSSGQIVSNCHKLPSQQFAKTICDSELLIDLSLNTFKKIIEFNPNLKIIITVSPVKYVRDGLIENNRSKARLIMLAEELCSRFEQIEYFPSYELLIDDLRDYRYYNDDMVHPSAKAIQYIWEFFLNSYCEEKTIKTVEKINQLNSLINHKPLHNVSSDLLLRNSKIESLKNEILSVDPTINLDINK